MEVHGLHRIAGDGVHGVQYLGHSEQVPVVLPVAVAPIPAQAGHERWAGHAGVGDEVAADLQVPMYVEIHTPWLSQKYDGYIKILHFLMRYRNLTLFQGCLLYTSDAADE